jgi:hypothetical protein
MCVVAERYGDMFNHYAELLDIKEGTLLLPDIGGAALVGRLQVIDLAGLADYEIAELRGKGDYEGLRDHVFQDLKPTFIHAHEAWGAGIPLDPRLARDYAPLYTKGELEGDWVRRDAIGPDGSLSEAQEYAAREVPAVTARYQTAPRQGCTFDSP